MDDQMKNMGGSFKDKLEFLKNIDPNQKIIALTVFALVISTLVVLTFWINRVHYRVLYSGLTMEDAHKISESLDEKSVKYKLEDNGKTILVPSEEVYQLRLDLAGEGVPASGTVGFELFDTNDFQSSDFSENVKYVRALQGELSRTINQLEAVEDSRINLSVPRRRIYLDEAPEASASVVLKIRSSMNLSEDEVRGIGKLVASSVQGLVLENVTIMSTDGELLSEAFQEGAFGLSSYQLRLKNELQKQVEVKVKTLLDSVLGHGKSVVNASVDIKTESKAIQRETFKPADEEGQTGVIRSTQTMVENYESQNNAAGANAAENDRQQAQALNENGQPLYRQQSQTTNYEVSKEVINETIAPGEINRLTVGVLIDNELKLTQQQMADLEEVIASACGIDPQRGDTLTLKTMKFNVTDLGEAAPAPGWQEYLKKYAPIVIPAFAPLLILIILMGKMKKAAKEKEKEEAAAQQQAKQQPQKGRMIDISAQGPDEMPVPGAIPAMGAPGGGPGGNNVEDIQATIKDFARKNPQLVASVFEKWVTSKE